MLYLSFGPPVAASESRVLENDVVVRYNGERIIGLTTPSLKKRLKRLTLPQTVRRYPA